MVPIVVNIEFIIIQNLIFVKTRKTSSFSLRYPEHRVLIYFPNWKH